MLEIYQKIFEQITSYVPPKGLSPDVMREIESSDSVYYKWLACAMRILKPKSVIEMGAAGGLSALMMLSELPETSILYSVDINPRSWWLIPSQYKNLVKVVGNDELIDTFKGIRLDKIDFWFIDSVHEASHLNSQFNLYMKYMKKGAFLAFDDIKDRDMLLAWQCLPLTKKLDVSDLHKNQGFGIAIC